MTFKQFADVPLQTYLTMAASNSPSKPLSSHSKHHGSEFYKLVENSSKPSINSFSLPTSAGKSSGGGGGGGRKHRRGSRDNSLLPQSYKTHLASLFTEIETEFESLYLENVRLREQIGEMEKACMDNNKIEADDADGFDMNVIKSFPQEEFPPRLATS